MFVVVMGVSGSGKSTLGSMLAAALGWDFLEGDDLHPPANIDKMRAGFALDDADRWPWLDRIASWMRSGAGHGRHGVVACSALKHSYRDHLRRVDGDLRFVYLRVAREELERRLARRRHFMPASLLDSQLQILQAPDVGEHALTLDSGTSSDHAVMDELVQQVLRWIGH